jgi:hypothetical protein
MEQEQAQPNPEGGEPVTNRYLSKNILIISTAILVLVVAVVLVYRTAQSKPNMKKQHCRR